jgi:predicted protein tyrosine phosphatase
VTFPRYLDGPDTNTRYVAERLIVASEDGAAESVPERTVKLDLRNDREAAAFPVESHGRIAIDDLPHTFHTSKWTCERIVAWYVDALAQWPDATIVLFCHAGCYRSAAAAYTVLRVFHGVEHNEAVRRVRTRLADGTADTFTPCEWQIDDAGVWCDARLNTGGGGSVE